MSKMATRDVKKKRKKAGKPSLKESIDKITSVFEEHLSTLPVEEQEARVAAFERGVARASRAKRSAIPSRRAHSEDYRVSVRARES
jgi:hypothetical protein